MAKCKSGDVIAVFMQGTIMERNVYDDKTKAKELIGGYAIDVDYDFVMDCSLNLATCVASKCNSNYGCDVPGTTLCIAVSTLFHLLANLYNISELQTGM